MADENTNSSPKREESEKVENEEGEMLPPTVISTVKQSPKPKESEKKEETPELPYKEPAWSGIPEGHYFLEVLKNGCIVKTINLNEKAYFVVGRLPVCDIVIEHPSSSRYHAVIQYKADESSKGEKGFCIYDLGSTHGTFLNKTAVDPRKFYRLRVGYVLKFGGSSRLFIFQGPEELEEEEDVPTTVTKSKKSDSVGRVMTQEEYDEWKESKNKPVKDEEDGGISWGFGEDAVEESAYPSNFGENPEEAEEHFFKDPKKTLRGYFEREGLDLEYQVEETGPGHARSYHCRVKLPIDTASGEPLYGEATVVGKKKEAVLACATECCRLLDIYGLLRQSRHESRKHKDKNWEENDYYDSDEDNFLDRTGAVERKRLQRMKRAGKQESSVETFETLNVKLESVQGEIASIEEKLKNAEVTKGRESEDSLEAFMSSLGSTMDKSMKTLLRRRMFELKKEKQRLLKLIEIARPASLPQLIKSSESSAETSKANSKETAAAKQAAPQTVTKTTATSSDNSASQTTEQKTRHHPVAGSGEQTVQNKGDKMQTASTSESTNSSNIKSNKLAPVQETAAASEKNNSSKETFPGFAVPKPVGYKKSKPKTKQPKESKNDEKSDCKEQKRRSAGEKREDIYVTKQETGLGFVQARDGSPIPDASDEDSSKQEEVIPRKKKKRSYGAPTKWEAVSDPTYSAWMPPKDQTGDGRTHLNEKFGY